MKLFSMAVQADISQNILKAAKLYEKAIKSKSPNVDSFINLAVLYWDATDFGKSVTLPRPFFDIAATRYPQVISLGLELFEDNPELLFWEDYCKAIRIGDPMNLELYIELVNKYPTLLTPYFVIWPEKQNKKDYNKVIALYEKCKQLKTTKNRYILSVVEGSL